MTSSKLPYLGLIVAAIMFYYGIINLIASVPLIIMGMPYGWTEIHSNLFQNMIPGIILVMPGCIVFWKSKMLRELRK